MIAQHPPSTEFSRPVPVAQLGEQGTERTIDASAAERTAVAERLGLLSLDRLKATVQLQRLGRELIRVTGEFVAELTQSCVVTLDPVPGRLTESFALSFTLAPAREQGDVTVAPDGEDPPEPAAGGIVDIGEAVVQQLALSLDPYPRAAGAEIPAEYDVDSGDNVTEQGPFATLKVLKENG